MAKYQAVLTRWDDTEEIIDIGTREAVDDIVFAVESQLAVKTPNIIINGATYKHVDVYEI